MALTWSIDKVEALMDNDLDKLITEAVVFHTLTIGLGDITESNWQEFYARVAFMENLEGPSLTVPKWSAINAHNLRKGDWLRLPEVADPDLLYYYHTLFYDSYEQSNVLEVRDYEYKQSGGPSKGETPRLFVLNSNSVIERHDGFEPRAITPQDVHRRIGLSTNVSNESRSKWTMRTMDRELDRLTQRAANG